MTGGVGVKSGRIGLMIMGDKSKAHGRAVKRGVTGIAKRGFGRALKGKKIMRQNGRKKQCQISILKW